VDTKPDGERQLVARYECMDCGQVGSDVDLRSHAERGGCRNFRVTTILVSPNGKLLDERVEVCQC
jgi:hypothetical protein